MIDRSLTWAPRAGGVAFALAIPFIGVKAFAETPHTVVTIVALVMHLLLSGVVLVLVYAAWHREWLGWVGALSMLGFYLWTRGASVPWDDASLISGGLPLLGMLYAWNAERRRRRFPCTPQGPDPVIRRDSGRQEWLQKRNSGGYGAIRGRASGDYTNDILFLSTDP